MCFLQNRSCLISPRQSSQKFHSRDERRAFTHGRYSLPKWKRNRSKRPRRLILVADNIVSCIADFATKTLENKKVLRRRYQKQVKVTCSYAISYARSKVFVAKFSVTLLSHRIRYSFRHFAWIAVEALKNQCDVDHGESYLNQKKEYEATCGIVPKSFHVAINSQIGYAPLVSHLAKNLANLPR